MEKETRFTAMCLVLSFCLALAPAAFARDAMGETRPRGESYFMFQVGAVTSDGNTDWSLNGVYGRYILNNVALEGSVGYYSADYSYGEQTVWPVSFSIKAGIPVDRFFPYGIAGVDVHFIDADQGRPERQRHRDRVSRRGRRGVQSCRGTYTRGSSTGTPSWRRPCSGRSTTWTAARGRSHSGSASERRQRGWKDSSGGGRNWSRRSATRPSRLLLILVIGRWAAKALRNVTRRIMGRSAMDPTLVSFVESLVYFAILAFVVLAALAQLGIQTTSFIALIGAAGLAVGLALQGSLANFASGVLLLIFRPFKVGDYIEGAGVAGVVEEIHIFTTLLGTLDNKAIIIPNSKLTGDNITNYTRKDTRRRGPGVRRQPRGGHR